MKKTGQLLREAREASGVSLQEVSVHLKISIRILKALEEGDQENLPAKTFLRGFVKSYAQLLRLDQNQVLDLFQQEMGSTHPKMITKQVEMAAEPIKYTTNVSAQEEVDLIPRETTTPVDSSLKENKKETPSVVDYQATPLPPTLSVDQKTWSHSMKIMTVGVILVIGAVIFGVLRTIEKYEREAQVVQPLPAELQAVPRTEGESAALPLETVLPNEPVVATDLPTPTASPEPVSATPIVGIPSALPAPSVATVASPVPTPTMLSKPVATVTASPTPTPTPTNTASKRSHEVIVEALDKVVIDYSIDGKPGATMTLTAEKVHTFRGDKKLSLGFSDGGSVNLIYNGKDKGVPGNLGKPLKISFP